VSGARLVRAGDVELCVETFGDAGAPAIVLISGQSSSMDWWDPEFCGLLARGPRHVVRYDLRDTGQSTTWPAGAPGYTFDDLVTDVPALLDALGIARAHIAGISMGGAIAQYLGVLFADRVATLTLLSTSSVGPSRRELPPMDARLGPAFAAPPPDPADRDAVIEHGVMIDRLFAGSLPYDEDARRVLLGAIYDRTRDIAASLTNHPLLGGELDVGARHGEIAAPTLVVHGSEDPLFPPAHGEALAAEIPGARLLMLDRVGHEVPPRPVWDIVVAAILEHTADAARRAPA